MEIKKIAIMGSGAVGSYYGALLCKQGYDVTFVSRGENLKSLQTNGLKVKSFFGDFLLEKVKATNNTKDVGIVDLILFCTKTYDVKEASMQVKPMVASNTVILPLQNANMTEVIGDELGINHVLGGVTYVFTAIESPGVIKQTSSFHKIVFGELTNKSTERIKAIDKVFTSIGITSIPTNKIQAEMWSKLLLMAPMGSISSLVMLPAGQYRNVPEVRDLFVNSMKEILKLAKAENIILPKDIIDQKMSFIDNLEPNATSSMQRDFQNNKKSEVYETVGNLIDIGERNNVKTPNLRFIYASLKPREIVNREKLRD